MAEDPMRAARGAAASRGEPTLLNIGGPERDYVFNGIPRLSISGNQAVTMLEGQGIIAKKERHPQIIDASWPYTYALTQQGVSAVLAAGGVVRSDEPALKARAAASVVTTAGPTASPGRKSLAIVAVVAAVIGLTVWMARSK